MNTKLLKQKILDLAIRGKLVPQDPNDEPASELLKRIRAEKEKFIAEGKIKRSKQKTSDKPHYENVPFEIPKSWAWTTIQEISASIMYGVSESAKTVGKYKLLRITDIQENTVDWNTVPYTDFDTNKAESYLLQDNDILFARTGATVGKSYLVKGLKEPSIYASYLIRVQASREILPRYIKYFFESGYYWDQISNSSVGTGQPNVNGTLLGELCIPIPPYSEQNCIVTEIEKWFAIIDDIETNKQDLENAIIQAKSKVLSLAINGKIVPQYQNEEPAIELLKRIDPKFQPCDTSHYPNLPSNWGLSTIKDLCTVISGLWKGKNPPFVNIGVIRNTNFSKDFRLDISDVAYLDVEQKQYEKRRLIYGDLILEKSGGSEKQPVGRTILYDKTDGEFSFSNFTAVLRINNKTIITPQYLYFALLNAYLNGATRMMQKQTTGIRNLIMERYLAITIPIPPIHEQERIVQSLENIYKIIDTINAEL